ncbi:helicase C-terminal domain-containing protein [Acidithiobacillus marinus]|uniref:helicase C-terminal domain-containing protein n=1 Tax=Acidithiobacillus marinus TaxID=187490 RepID=UPI001552C48C|nr:helicase C-terminal domain-containing protein [Acidithiobacillus marinus]
METEKTRHYFGEDGILSKTMHYRPRAPQQGLAEQVFACMDQADALRGERCAILPAQGDTGIGKTLATLIPMLDQVARHHLAGQKIRCGYATHTTQLRRQTAERDLPAAIRAVANTTGITLTVAEYCGATQFVSPQAVQWALANSSDQADKMTQKKLKKLQQWLNKKTTSGLMVDAKEALGVDEHDPLIPGKADKELACEYQEARTLAAYQSRIEQAKNADVILMSHAAALLNARRWFAILDNPEQPDDQDTENVPEDRQIRYMIFDEAHRLPEAGDSLASRTLSLHRLVHTLENAHSQSVGEIDAALVKQARELREAAKMAVNAVDDNSDEKMILDHQTMPGNSGMTVQKFLMKQGLQELYLQLLQRIKGVKTAKMSQDARLALLDVYSTCDVIGDYLDIQLKGNPYQMVAGMSWSAQTRRPSIHMSTANPGRLVARYWRHYPGKAAIEDAKGSRLWGAVIISATMPEPSSIGLFQKNEEKGKEAWHKQPFLMVEDVRDPPIFEPEKFGEMRFVLSMDTPPTMRSEKSEKEDGFVNPEWEKQHLFPMIDAMLTESTADQGVLILTPTIADVDKIATHIAATGHDSRVIAQSAEKNMAMCAHQCRENPGSILVSAGGWDGLDLPGGFQNLMIARLPIAPIDRLHEQILMEKYDPEAARKILHASNKRLMISKLRQGIGRGIRRSEDCVTVWIADSRFGLPSYPCSLGDPRVMPHASPLRAGIENAIPKRFRWDLEHARLFSTRTGTFTPETPKTRQSGSTKETLHLVF